MLNSGVHTKLKFLLTLAVFQPCASLLALATEAPKQEPSRQARGLLGRVQRAWRLRASPEGVSIIRLRPESVAGLFLGLCSVIGAFGQAKIDSDATQPEVLLMLGHASNRSALAISPDGRHLATSSMDKTVLIWDVDSATEVRVLQHAIGVTAVTFVSNTEVATGTSDGNLLVWNIETGGIEKSGSVGNWIKCLYTSPDGKEIWGTILVDGVFAVSSSNLTAVARYESDFGVAVSKKARMDGAYAIVRWSDKSALVEWWKASARIERGTPHRVGARITSGAITSDGPDLMLGTEDGVVHRMSGSTDDVGYPGVPIRCVRTGMSQPLADRGDFDT